eukprot:CAMPEP_0202891696 /NCGR_PEP_ID=MMETSP1392-20130828/1692_1 /ASSEMBLY_ACC=CAM_ASM_000868 /TAXON_ID=225041 /ORGANISM="Chlamydomonas chlamydogama, Strain SAG 11-48b" /LENGTH=340 /DNA_ID=CAMNT_0049575523 /DNA_START=45 /DNA_END=1064 /DNA_ORIENTATION=+
MAKISTFRMEELTDGKGLAQALRTYGVCILESNEFDTSSLSGHEMFFGQAFANHGVYAMKQMDSDGYELKDMGSKYLLAYKSTDPEITEQRQRNDTVIHTSEKVFRQLDGLSRTVLSALSSALTNNPNRLLQCLEPNSLPTAQTSSSVLHVFSYKSKGEGAPPHDDRGLLTLVVSQQERGLQVILDGVLHDLPLGPGRVAVMAGLTLQYATGGVIPATTHSVLPDTPGRLSLAFKLRAPPGTLLDPPALMAGCSLQLHPDFLPPRSVSDLMDDIRTTHPVSINMCAEHARHPAPPLAPVPPAAPPPPPAPAAAAAAAAAAEGETGASGSRPQEGEEEGSG